MATILEQYLVDGLYAEFDGYHVVLKANSSTDPTDTVYLDPHVLASFEKFIKGCRAALTEEPRAGE